MREADVANHRRTGGSNRWTPEEDRILEEQWQILCSKLPGRAPSGIAQRLSKRTQGYA